MASSAAFDRALEPGRPRDTRRRARRPPPCRADRASGGRGPESPSSSTPSRERSLELGRHRRARARTAPRRARTDARTPASSSRSPSAPRNGRPRGCGWGRGPRARGEASRRSIPFGITTIRSTSKPRRPASRRGRLGVRHDPGEQTAVEGAHHRPLPRPRAPRSAARRTRRPTPGSTRRERRPATVSPGRCESTTSVRSSRRSRVKRAERRADRPCPPGAAPARARSHRALSGACRGTAPVASRRSARSCSSRSARASRDALLLRAPLGQRANRYADAQRSSSGSTRNRLLRGTVDQRRRDQREARFVIEVRVDRVGGRRAARPGVGSPGARPAPDALRRRRAACTARAPARRARAAPYRRAPC